MNRRGFLGAILAAGVAPAVVKASSLMPVFVRKELGGLLVPDGVGGMHVVMRSNSLLTIEMITKESLLILERNLLFTKEVNGRYLQKFGDRITVRTPQPFIVKHH